VISKVEKRKLRLQYAGKLLKLKMEEKLRFGVMANKPGASFTLMNA